jgi:hypothetical protein
MSESITWTATRLTAAQSRCPARLHHVLDRIPTLPSDPLLRGLDFHLVAEVALTVFLAGGVTPEEAARRAIDQCAAGADVAKLIDVWVCEGGLALDRCMGAELELAIDADGNLVRPRYHCPDCGHNIQHFHGPTCPSCRSTLPAPPWLQGRLDRLDLWMNEGEPAIVVVDWKSGYSGWSGPQASVYMVLAECLTRAMLTDTVPPWLKVEALTDFPLTLEARIYSPMNRWHDPIVIPREDEALDDLFNEIRREVAAANCLASLPRTVERPGPGCERCDRRSICTAFNALAVVPPVLDAPDEADSAARDLLRTDTLKADLAQRLQSYVDLHGPVEVDGQRYGRFRRPETRVDAVAFYRTLFEQYAALIATGNLDEAAQSAALIAPPGVTQAKALIHSLDNPSLTETLLTPSSKLRWEWIPSDDETPHETTGRKRKGTA